MHTLSDVLKLVVNLQLIANHPQLIEPCDVVSPFHMDVIGYHTAHLVDFAFDASKRDVRVTSHLDNTQILSNTLLCFICKYLL